MLPQDPFILLSFVNTELRDNFSSLAEFCAAHGADVDELTARLSAAGFEYDPEQNRFR